MRTMPARPIIDWAMQRPHAGLKAESHHGERLPAGGGDGSAFFRFAEYLAGTAKRIIQ